MHGIVPHCLFDCQAVDIVRPGEGGQGLLLGPLWLACQMNPAREAGQAR